MDDITKKLQKMVQTRKTPAIIEKQQLYKKYQKQSIGTSIESYAFSDTSS